MANKSKAAQEQLSIAGFIEELELASNVRSFEIGGDPIKFTRHDGYTFSIPRYGKKLILKISIEEEKS